MSVYIRYILLSRFSGSSDPIQTREIGVTIFFECEQINLTKIRLEF